jgi:hypothetical protein
MEEIFQALLVGNLSSGNPGPQTLQKVNILKDTCLCREGVVQGAKDGLSLAEKVGLWSE